MERLDASIEQKTYLSRINMMQHFINYASTALDLVMMAGLPHRACGEALQWEPVPDLVSVSNPNRLEHMF